VNLRHPYFPIARTVALESSATGGERQQFQHERLAQIACTRNAGPGEQTSRQQQHQQHVRIRHEVEKLAADASELAVPGTPEISACHRVSFVSTGAFAGSAAPTRRAEGSILVFILAGVSKPRTRTFRCQEP
jgi:hypothetical protein